MVSMKLPAKIDQDSAYIVVANHISQEYGPQTVNIEHIRSITHAAFSYLKQQGDTSIERWKQGRVPDAEQKEKLISAVKNVLISAKTPWQPTLILESRIQMLFFDVMRGNPPPIKQLLKEHNLLRAVIWKKNPELLKDGRELLNKIFVNMFQEIAKKPLTDTESFHMEMIIGDLLSLYPFLGPENGEKLEVPTRVNGAWQLATYHVEKIELTPHWMGSPLVAVGLKPQDSEMSPLLLFKGTTYPTDKGFGLSLLTDLNPLASVGDYAFRMGRKKIQAWLDTHADKKKAIVYGKSLGGAQAWRTALKFPKKVKKVMAYGAPGLSSSDIEQSNQVFKSSKDTPEINVFCQKGDRVPYYDKVAKGFNYFKVMGDKSRKGMLAHADMYSTHEKSLIIRMDETRIEKKWRRTGLTILRLILSIFMFPLLILGHAAQTAIKKFVRLIDNHVVKKILPT